MNHPFETRGWILLAIFAELGKFKAAIAKDPLIPMGPPDPHTPPTAARRTHRIEIPDYPPVQD